MITQIGKHRIQHGDIMEGIDNLMGTKQADFIYTDPPWGKGTLKYFKTLNKKQTGLESKDWSWSEFLDKLFITLSKYAKDAVIIEMGIRWRDDIIEQSQKHNFIHGGTVESFYGDRKKNLPLDLHIISKSGLYERNPILEKELIDKRGFNVVDCMFEEFCPSGGIVLDPMCGMGYTARACIKRHLTFYGNEINEKRLQKTAEKLNLDLNK